MLAKAFGDLPWPKSMRWADDSQRWVRPLHSILVLFDGEALAGSFAMAEGRAVAFGETTAGHRFLAPQRFTVISFADYRDKLRAGKVVMDAAERRDMIAEQAAVLAKEAGVTMKDDPGLLDEVAGLVEWPQVLMGRIDEAFMTLPGEVLSTSMRSHQKYFSTETAGGSLADRFIFVANMEAAPGSDRAKTIVAGNERVLKPRLADARFSMIRIVKSRSRRGCRRCRTSSSTPSWGRWPTRFPACKAWRWRSATSCPARNAIRPAPPRASAKPI